LARRGITIDGLYHYNNQGKIANSYKFRSKPDHIYELKGADPSDLTVCYRGRLRAIPRKRRLQGNGLNGYEVDIVEVGQAGRPAHTQRLVIACLRTAGHPMPLTKIIERTGLSHDAVKSALKRAENGPVLKDAGLYCLRTAGDEQELKWSK
jgi:hypothetical protein